MAMPTKILLTLAAGLGALLLVHFIPVTSVQVLSVKSEPLVSSEMAEPEYVAGRHFAEIPFKPSASQQNTEIDGHLSFDQQGNLIANPALGELFEYLLADVDKLGFASVRSQLVALLEAEDNYVIARRELAQNTELTAQEREQQLAQLDSSLPSHIRQAREQSLLAVNLSQRTEQLRKQGASQAEIMQLREQTVGAEAALRLQALDEKRQQWQQRVKHYQQQRDAIVRNSGLSAEQQQRALSSLRQEQFNEQEIRRIKAIEHFASSDS